MRSLFTHFISFYERFSTIYEQDILSADNILREQDGAWHPCPRKVILQARHLAQCSRILTCIYLAADFYSKPPCARRQTDKVISVLPDRRPLCNNVSVHLSG